MREEARIMRFLQDRLASGQGSALATVIRVQGSAYRREGARLAIDREGHFAGMISGGCLEADVAETARQVISSGKPVLHHFDLRDESPFGLGLGCDGVVDVLIEPVSQNFLWQAWLEALREGQRAVRAILLEQQDNCPVGSVLICHRNAQLVGQLDNSGLKQAVASRCRELYRDPEAASGVQTISTARVFFDINLPAPSLFIFGAGDDVKPLSPLAQQAGFRVTIVDPRTAYLTPERFPGASLIVAQPEDFQDNVELSPGGFFLIMNHQLERDRAALEFVLGSDPTYVGVLGPRARFAKLAGDTQSGYSTGESEHILFNPVGLDIGAEGPDEVAISIVAELLAVRRGLKGGFLRDRRGAIHPVPEGNKEEVDRYAGRRETSDKGLA